MTADSENSPPEGYVGAARRVVSSIRSPALAEPAKAYLKNAEDLRCLISLPTTLFQGSSLINRLLLVDGTTAYPEGGREAWARRISERASALSPADVKAIEEENLQALGFALDLPDVMPAVTSLLRASIVSAWTLIECAASDVWVAALNSRSDLGHRVWSSVKDREKDSELSNKQISISEAARFGFDLRNCLGTILKRKFDFTSTSGIRDAYRILPGCEPQAFAVASVFLTFIEAYRNVVVHRAGRVDEQFLARTRRLHGLPFPQWKIDDEVECTLDLAVHCAEAAVLFAGHLLTAVDEHLQRLPDQQAVTAT